MTNMRAGYFVLAAFARRFGGFAMGNVRATRPADEPAVGQASAFDARKRTAVGRGSPRMNADGSSQARRRVTANASKLMRVDSL